MQTEHLILTRRPDPVKTNKKENLLNSGLCCRSGPLKENQRKRKRVKYLDLTRELEELGNTRVTVIPIVIGALWSIPKSLIRGLEELEIRGRAMTAQNTALLR